MDFRVIKKNSWLLCILFLISTNLFIILDIPFFREVFGFLFLTVIPGALIVRILNLEGSENIEKILLAIGLSISFVLFFGFAMNELLLAIGYPSPLSTTAILVFFNLAYILLSTYSYMRNKSSLFSFTQFHMNTFDKPFLLVSSLFPTMSIFGMYVMNESSNPYIILFLFISIALYILFVCFYHQSLSKHIYPMILFLISVSIVILLPLRSKHLIGTDVHYEYYFFHITLENLYWSILGNSTLNSCLTISLLPTVYYSIVGVYPEYLYKILFSTLFSISPLIIYVISKKYIEESYAFLTSFFFISQAIFIYTAANARTSIGILFFALAMMVFFSDKITVSKRKLLFIIFISSCLVSHYSTTYIFFVLLSTTYLLRKIIEYKYKINTNFSIVTIELFFVLIFYWYSLQTSVPFIAGVNFFEKTIISLNDMFLQETTISSDVQIYLGTDIIDKNIAYKINFIFNWASIVFIVIGAVSLLLKYEQAIAVKSKSITIPYLKEKFSVDYFVTAIICIGILCLTIVVPYLTQKYEISRIYGLTSVLLSVFFVIGGISLSRKLNLNSYFVILLILIPCFFASTGVNYAIFDKPQSIILSSSGQQYDLLYVYDQETYSSQWIREKANKENLIVYTDSRGRLILTSQGSLDLRSEARNIQEDKIGSNYLYLRHNVVKSRQLYEKEDQYTINNEPFFINEKNKIYENGCIIYK